MSAGPAESFSSVPDEPGSKSSRTASHLRSGPDTPHFMERDFAGKSCPAQVVTKRPRAGGFPRHGSIPDVTRSAVISALMAAAACIPAAAASMAACPRVARSPAA